jgi:hypothetical protein
MVCYYFPHYEAAIPSKLKNFVTSPEEPSATFKNHIQTVLSIFQALVSQEEYKLVIEAKWPVLAPIEFVYIGALISKAAVHACAGLAGMIYQFRSTVRSKHKDIRLNDSVARTMFTYIDNLVIPAELTETESTTFSPSRKRRRGLDDDDYRPGRDD